MNNTKTSNGSAALAIMAVLVFLQVVFSGATGISILVDNPYIAGIIAIGSLVVAAGTAGVQFYVRGSVMDRDRVVEYITGSDTVVAGPSNDRVAAGHVVRTLDEGSPGVEESTAGYGDQYPPRN